MTIGPDKLQAITAAAKRSVEADIPDAETSEEIAAVEREASLTLKQQATLFQKRYITRLEEDCSCLRDESVEHHRTKDALQVELQGIKLAYARLEQSVISYERLDWPISIGFLVGTLLMGGFQLTTDPVGQKVFFFMGASITGLLTALNFFRVGRKRES